ncbi:MAG: cytochrome c maturation protein CcmE [Acidobacteriota bacterium]|jgi:cytochrome c-type biogenesis protein CcmE
MGVRSRQVAIAVGVILVAVIYVVITGMRDTMVYYYTVSEVAARQAELTGEPLRVAGHVVPGTIDSDSSGLMHRFVIEEGGKTMPVVYRDIVPDTFKDNAEAVVEGTLDENGTFQATFLMAKCPSKYEAETDYAKYREQGVVAPGGGQ